MSATVDKIRKLLNLASNEAASPNEADTARKLAESLMEAAGISEADISADGDVDPVSTFGVSDDPAPEVGWHGVLAVAVARVVGCYVHRTNKRDGDRIIIVRRWAGTEAQRDAARTLHAWLLEQVERLARGARKIAASQPSPRAYLGAYRRGLANSIAAQARQRVESRAPIVVASEERALARQSALEQRITAYCKENKLPRENVRKSTYTTKAISAWHAGNADGRSVRLQRDVAGSTAKRLTSGGG